MDAHVDIDVALSKTRYVPRHLRLLAVKAELKERAKPKRDMTQEAVARLFGVTGRMLRYWVERYLAEGVEGLRARGGQGRKRDVSREDVAKAVRDSIESSMAESGGGDGGGSGGEKPTCRACLAEDAEGGKASRQGGKHARPKKCKCRGRCAVPGKCRCKMGRVCKCRCCRPLKHPPKGPRHDPDCARQRAEPRGATRAAAVRDLIHARHGKRYHLHHVHALMNESGVTYHKVSKSASNHASVGEVRSWAWRQDGRLEPYRKAGYRIGVYDVAFVGMDGATGRMWIERGKKATLPSGRSRQTIAVHGIWFSDGTRFVREYKHADSYTLIDFLKEASAKCGKMILYADRSSINSSEDTRRFLRDSRRLRPDRDVRIFLLPVGSPFLSVIEEFWNLLKDAVTKRYRYLSFNALRWATMEYARTAVVKLDMYKYMYRDPKKYVPAA